MELKRKIRVLVVDDSMLFREVLSKGISTDDHIEVVATAKDPFDARDKIIQYLPDVMTCDIEMPRMNGIEFVKKLMPQHPIPIIVVSSLNKAVFDAINAGAVDFVGKPDLRSVHSVENFLHEMITKIKIASCANIMMKTNQDRLHQVDQRITAYDDKMIAIGASTGGTEAIYNIIKQLPTNVPGVVVVQHIPPDFSRMFAERLNNSVSLHVKEAETGDYIETGRVLIAPGNKHMRVKKIGSRYRVECFTAEKVNGHCPSVDVLFESVAKEVGDKAIGVILTGMGYDGAKGLLAMKRKGARTIGQDEASSVVYGMPKVAYNLGAVESQVSLAQIASTICSLLQ